MRISFFTHYFPPEGNAPASRTYDHCVRWAKQGHEITVITSAPNVPDGVVYDGYRNRFWPQRETIDGIHVVRVWTYIASNSGNYRRILNYVTYMLSSILAYCFFCRRPKIVIATSPQFFCGWAGVIASYLKWTPLVLEIRDIWPESIVTVGAMRPGLTLLALEVLEKWMYRCANHIVVVTDGLKQQVLTKAKTEDQISVVTNGVDLDRYIPKEKSPDSFSRFDLNGQFVCSYVGTLGMAHGLKVVLDAAATLRDQGNTNVAFLLVGDGADRDNLEAECQQRELTRSIKFAGRVNKSEIPEILANSDAMLIHLKESELFQSAIPSKIFEAMAMNRPLIVGVKGEVANIIQRSKSGILFEPENGQQLAEIVLSLAGDEKLQRELSTQGREFVAQHYSRDLLAGRLLNIIKSVAMPPKNSLDDGDN